MLGATSNAAQSPDAGRGGQPATARSLLLIDCGSAFTKVALVGLVEGVYRLLASVSVPTTLAAPQADIMLGVRNGISEIERITGRIVMRAGQPILPEDEDGSGVDLAVLVASAEGPLRLMALGPGRESLAMLLQRALSGLFIQLETQQLPLPDSHMSASDLQRLTGRLQAVQPHAALIIGPPTPAPGNAVASTAQSVAQAIDILQPTAMDVSYPRPTGFPVIFSGTQSDAQVVANILQGRTTVESVEALAPSTLAPLTRAVGALYESCVLREAPGYATLRRMVATPPIATVTSLGGVARFLAHHHQMNVVAVDVGANSTELAGATARGEFLPAVFPTAGVGAGGAQLARAVGVENILRWMTAPIDEDDLREYILTHMLRPRLLPATPQALEIQYALAREAIRLAMHAPGARMAGLHPMDIVLGTGGVLAHAAHPADAALILLDSLQPRGITSLVLDSAQIAGMLGNLAMISPDIAAALCGTDATPLLLGSVISAEGAAPEGELAVRVALEFMDGRQEVAEVASGSLARLTIAPGEPAMLSVYPAPSVDIGLGPGQLARSSEPVVGGALGLMVDARGRPLRLALEPEIRVQQLRAWQATMRGEAER
ncbi:MAG TPA: glutamate mutase L [Ktedonobacterales bacterium]|nr:glutamate mutase L [Ktedonobacterales bacterium]